MPKTTRRRTSLALTCVGEETKVVVTCPPEVTAKIGMATEGLCATCVAPGLFRLDSFPLGVFDLAFADVVAAEPYGEVFRMSHKVLASGWRSYSGWFTPPCLADHPLTLRNRLYDLGATIGGGFGLVNFSVGVPPGRSVAPIEAELRAETYRRPFQYWHLSDGF